MLNPNQQKSQLIDDVDLWPIAKLYSDRNLLVQSVKQDSLDKTISKGDSLDDLIAKTIYSEQDRIKNNPWKVDPGSEPKFWKKMRKDFLESKSNNYSEEKKDELQNTILNTITERYAEEIVGGFRSKSVSFARKFLRRFFTILLSTTSLVKTRGRKRNFNMADHIKMYGNIDKIRNLFNEGIVVIIPTHFSNMDSLLIAYSLDDIAGIPSFSYGAGLNLHNAEVVSYFLSRLGTYRIDRRKRNPIYLETLKSFSRVSIGKGTNTIFFPGGTRSRSGKIETKLKYGLLTTLVETQRELIEKGSKQKLFIVPMVLGYNAVLEARSLIHQFLSKQGEEKFLASRDSYLSISQIIKFATNYFQTDSELTVSVGDVIDVLGNSVQENGISIDKWGREIKLSDYFSEEGKIIQNKQREFVYTKRLAGHIIDSFHKNNIILSSHLLAYVSFKIIKARYPNVDIYDFLNQKDWDTKISYDELKSKTKKLVKKLLMLEEKNELLVENRIRKSFKKILVKGLYYLGAFHNTNVLAFNEQSNTFSSEDLKLLYYYHNRLDTYSFDAMIAEYNLEDESHNI